MKTCVRVAALQCTRMFWCQGYRICQLSHSLWCSVRINSASCHLQPLPLPVSACVLLLQTGWPELAPGVGSWLVQVVRFIILLAQAVPISLYVSLETVKVAQCKVR